MTIQSSVTTYAVNAKHLQVMKAIKNLFEKNHRQEQEEKNK